MIAFNFYSKPISYFRDMALLSITNLIYKEHGRRIINDISFQQEPFERIAVVGETGSGKSTLLKLIGGFTQKDGGEIYIENAPVIGPYDQLIPGHPGTAYLSQHFELRNNYWVHEILEYANKLSSEEANALYKICRIDHLLDRRTNQLSGGEKQRIALARILIGKPGLLLLDEPFSNLDANHKSIIKKVIADISDQFKTTCLLVSHDAADILSWADKVIILKDGCIQQLATPTEIYHTPVNEYCAGLFGMYSLISQAVLESDTMQPFGKQLLLRPEQLYFSDKGNYHLKGIVSSVLFYGSHYIIEVLIAGNLVFVSSESSSFKPGDSVYLSIQNHQRWYV